MMRLAMLGLLLLLGVNAHAQRVQTSLNDGWRFAYEPSGDPSATSFDDAGWQRVTIPHTWNAEDAFDKEEGYRRGIGWYRKTFDVPAAWADRQLFLRFEGANQVAEVWVNGERQGEHVGGYTAFAFDVTDAVRVGAPNTIAVRVDNRHDDDIPPLNADFTFYGGVYRDVWLIATDAVHLDLLDHASSGVYLDTPDLAEGDPTVRLRTRVTNDSPVPAEVTVLHWLLDAEGNDVVRVSEPLAVPAGTTVEQTQRMAVDAPRLWSPDDPYVYRVLTEVVRGDGGGDSVYNPLGFRWVTADGDGFYLNGERLALHGTNRHQDVAGLGNALPDAYHRRDVRIVKENGFNFLRLAHYPQDPAVLRATDDLGLAVWEEIPIVNLITMSDAFAVHSERMLVEMIRQHYNHPSVVMWGYMNEVLLREPRPMPEGYVDAVRGLAERLERVAEREDPYRLTAMAFSNGEVVKDSGLQDVADVFGMNLYFGWYYDDFAALGTFLDSLHTAHPDRPLMISEYGAGTDERVHSASPRAFDFSVEHGAAFHRESFEQIRERDYLVGSGVWNQFDFGSNHRQDTKNAVNQKGLFFLDRTPKDIALWYRAVLTDAPVLHVEREHQYRASSDPAGVTQQIIVYSNAEEVTLLVNGEPRASGLPWTEANGGRMVFEVELEPGENRIEAVGRWPGMEASETEPPTDGLTRTDAVTIHFDDRSDCPTGSGPCVVALNVGGTYSVTGPTGLVYEADPGMRAGASGGTSAMHRTHHRIYGTALDPLFQAYRTIGPTDERSSMQLAAGSYDLTFSFMEPEHEMPGQRVFSVLVDGEPVIHDLDLAAEAGRWTAVERTVRLRVEELRSVPLEFVSTAGVPVLSALVIRRH